MDAEMQRMMKIRPLQEAVINYRATVSKYRTIMKKICVSESKSLINVEMTVDDVKLKLPDPQNIPPLTNLHRATNADYLRKQTFVAQKALELM